MIKLSVLGSGSKGNCVYVEFGDYGVLVDAGFPYKETHRRLALIGKSFNNVKTVFVSHGHKDHIAAVPQIQKKHLNISVVKDFHFGPIAICYHDCNFEPITTRPFLLSHDDPCYGFDFRYKDFKLTYIPDTGCITEDAARALFDIKDVKNHVVVIECNYDLQMLTEGKYDSELMERVFSDDGHMDNIETARILKEVRHDNLRLVMPFHLSSENNNPVLVKYEIGKAVGPSTQVVCTEQKRATQIFYYA